MRRLSPHRATLEADSSTRTRRCIHGADGSSENVVVQASSNLVDWVALRTNAPVTGFLNFKEPAPLNLGPRFYRVRED